MFKCKTFGSKLERQKRKNWSVVFIKNISIWSQQKWKSSSSIDQIFYIFNFQSVINLTHTHISWVSLQGTMQFLTYTIQVIFFCLLWRQTLWFIIFHWKQDTFYIYIYISGSNVSQLNTLLLLKLSDTSALHSWHVAALRSKERHTTDIFLLTEISYCTKCSSQQLHYWTMFICRWQCML